MNVITCNTRVDIHNYINSKCKANKATSGRHSIRAAPGFFKNKLCTDTRRHIFIDIDTQTYIR